MVRIILKKCRFSSTVTKALNLEAANNYLAMDLKDQFFSFDEIKEGKLAKNWRIALIVVVLAAAVIIIILLIIFVAKRKNPNVLDENKMNAGTHDILINESLLDSNFDNQKFLVKVKKKYFFF